jgi:hypothetical protein
MNVELYDMYGVQNKNWIICGGSYPGALSAWFRSLYPEHVLISWSSSGVINAIQDFSNFDLDIYKATSKSGEFCPNTISDITNYVDEAMKENSEALEEIQSIFGSHGVRNDDFMFYFADIFTIGV